MTFQLLQRILSNGQFGTEPSQFLTMPSLQILQNGVSLTSRRLQHPKIAFFLRAHELQNLGINTCVTISLTERYRFLRDRHRFQGLLKKPAPESCIRLQISTLAPFIP